MLCRVWRSAADRPGRGEREGGREGEGRGREREADGNGAQQSVSQGFMCEIINKRQHRGASTRSTNQSQHSHSTVTAHTAQSQRVKQAHHWGASTNQHPTGNR